MIPIVVGALGTITTKSEKYTESLGTRSELNMFRNQHC